MTDKKLHIFASHVSNKIYCGMPWNKKISKDMTDIIYGALKIIDDQNTASRLKVLKIISYLRTSPSILPMMSGAHFTPNQIIEIFDNIYDLLKINLPEMNK